MLIIAVVFAILGALFFVRSTAAGPINGDHWHATYQIIICGERQPNIPEFEAAAGSPGTHGDGVMHQHPFTPSGEGQGSNLANFFKEGGGKLTESEMQIPGTPKDKVYKNGDLCDDGRPAELQVFVNGAPQDNFLRYIAHDGDRVRILFGPEEVEPVRQEDRTIIAEGQATRTVELEISGGEADVAFSPASIDLITGETVKLAVKNTGSISHGFRVAGPDGEYETSDDFVSDPEIIPPGGEAVVVVRFDEEGEFEFRDPTIQQATGTIVVRAQEEEEEEVEETEAPEEVDVTFDVVMGDNLFEPAELEVEAGQSFRINLINEGELAHNLRITGPDGEYDTGDDLVSTPGPLRSGESGELVGQIDEPGVYNFRDDFHPTEAVGTITVK
jgi:plastocyanin